MSKYTTELRYICEYYAGLEQSAGLLSVNDIINKAMESIFDFRYPIFNNNYRVELQRKILKHFYTREIGEETTGLWKLRLETKLNEIMPYYNKLYESELIEFDPLYNTNITTTYTGTKNGNKNGSSKISEKGEQNVNDGGKTKTINGGKDILKKSGIDETTRNGVYSDDGQNTDLYSDTPQGTINNININDNSYLTNARKVTNYNKHDMDYTDTTKFDNTNTNTYDSTSDTSFTNTTNTDTTKTTNNDNTETTTTIDDFIQKTYGYSNNSPIDNINKLRESFLNIDMMIINELEVLFMNLW